jgi:hypothetical protein
MGPGIPDAGYDPSIEAKLAGMGFGSGTRSRRPSSVAPMGMMGGPGGGPDLTYGGAPFGPPGANGAGMRPSVSPGPGGIIPPGAGPPGGAGIMPGAAGGGMDGYTRDRRISQRSMRDNINAIGGLPGLGGLGAGLGAGLNPAAAGAGAGAGSYIRSPNGQVIPLGDAVSPQRTPISQIPPSPGHGLGRSSPYGAPTYGGLPGGAAAGAGMGGQAGPIVPAPAAQANISQYTAAQAFARPLNPGSRFSPFKPFPIFNNMDEMYEMLPEIPPLPAALVDHDVLFEDWARWMTVSGFALIVTLTLVSELTSCVPILRILLAPGNKLVTILAGLPPAAPLGALGCLSKLGITTFSSVVPFTSASPKHGDGATGALEGIADTSLNWSTTILKMMAMTSRAKMMTMTNFTMREMMGAITVLGNDRRGDDVRKLTIDLFATLSPRALELVAVAYLRAMEATHDKHMM